MPQPQQAPQSPQSQGPQQGQSPQGYQQGERPQQGSQPPHLQSDRDEQSIDSALESAISDVERGSGDSSEGQEGQEGETQAQQRAQREKPPQPKASVLASLHRREQQLQAQKAEWAKQQTEREQVLAEREAKVKAGKYSPWEALKVLGWEDPDKFIQAISEHGGEWTDEQKKIAELEEWKTGQMKAEEERQRQAKEDAQARQHKQLVDAWHADIAKFMKGSEKWSQNLVAIPGTEASVFQVIQDHYANTGERLDFDSACEAVEERMQDEFSNALRTVASNPRGLELIKGFVASLEPQQPKRGTSTARQRGISPNVRNQTRSDPVVDMDLDSALAAAANAMNQAG